jgi:hypothetical protein
VNQRKPLAPGSRGSASSGLWSKCDGCSLLRRAKRAAALLFGLSITCTSAVTVQRCTILCDPHHCSSDKDALCAVWHCARAARLSPPGILLCQMATAAGTACHLLHLAAAPLDYSLHVDRDVNLQLAGASCRYDRVSQLWQSRYDPCSNDAACEMRIPSQFEGYGLMRDKQNNQVLKKQVRYLCFVTGGCLR